MVILNTVVLAMENLDQNNPTLKEGRLVGNFIFTWIFIVELLLKLFSLGIKKYANDGMNLFDAFIVITSVIEMVFQDDSSG